MASLPACWIRSATRPCSRSRVHARRPHRAARQVEGGDLVWLDRQTLLAGIATAPISRRPSACRDRNSAFTVEAFDLPHYKAGQTCFPPDVACCRRRS